MGCASSAPLPDAALETAVPTVTVETQHSAKLKGRATPRRQWGGEDCKLLAIVLFIVSSQCLTKSRQCCSPSKASSQSLTGKLKCCLETDPSLTPLLAATGVAAETGENDTIKANDMEAAAPLGAAEMARSKKSRARRLSYVDHREEAKHGKAAAAATNNIAAKADDDKEPDDGEDVSLQDQTHVCFAYVVAASHGSLVRSRRRQQPQRKR